METKAEYITRLQAAIETLHKCRATHRRTVKVDESVPERWKGQVEIFWLVGHPSAKRCFAWVEPASDGSESRVIAVLEIPPVIGPATAVRAALSTKSSS